MPRSPAADAGHGVFTDHSIPRVPGRARARSAASWNLRGFSAADTGDRELGLAYAEVGVRTGNRRQQAEAIRLLTAAPPDAEVQVRLADLEDRAGNSARALALYQAALRQDPNAVAALVNLGRLYGSNGLLDEGIALWRKALQLNLAWPRPAQICKSPCARKTTPPAWRRSATRRNSVPSSSAPRQGWMGA